MRKALLLVVVLGCADSEPPTWGNSAALESSDVETTTLALSWGEASDNEALQGYELLQDGDSLETFGSDIREHTVAGLADATTYTFSIIAKDATGNPSEPLHVEVTTLDGTAPSFPADARIVAVPNEDATRVSLSWPEAIDNVGVERYEVQRDGEPVGQIDTTSLELDGSPDGIQVFAVDARGNTSTPIGSAGDAAARRTDDVADGEPTADGADPDMAPLRIELSPAVQRAVGRTQGTMINRTLRVTPMLQLQR